MAPMVVVAAALIGPDRRVLVQRRRLAAEHGGLWEFPGGKVEPGETCAGALVREIAEELDIALDPGDLAPLVFASKSHRPGRDLVLLLYTCRTWQGEPRALDAEALVWADRKALAALAMPPLDVELARSVIPLLM